MNTPSSPSATGAPGARSGADRLPCTIGPSGRAYDCATVNDIDRHLVALARARREAHTVDPGTSADIDHLLDLRSDAAG